MMRFGIASNIIAAQPVPFRLMSVLASTMNGADSPLREDGPIGFTPFDLKTVKHPSQFHAIEMQKPRQLAFT
jgi:hypothetical protein